MSRLKIKKTTKKKELTERDQITKILSDTLSTRDLVCKWHVKRFERYDQAHWMEEVERSISDGDGHTKKAMMSSGYFIQRFKNKKQRGRVTWKVGMDSWRQFGFVIDGSAHEFPIAATAIRFLRTVEKEVLGPEPVDTGQLVRRFKEEWEPDEKAQHAHIKRSTIIGFCYDPTSENPGVGVFIREESRADGTKLRIYENQPEIEEPAQAPIE